MTVSIYEQLEFGVTRIDTLLARPGLAACYLMEQRSRLAIIETGTAHTVPSILKLIADRGYAVDQVDFVIVTHVHLDHAGGAGRLMQALPNARLLVHERGARHMISPEKLQAGATAVYGEAKYNEQYGDLVPVPESRVCIMRDGDSVHLADRKLTFFDTPGHAKHHFCIYDSASGGIFTGDTLGVVYPELCAGFSNFVMPTTTPVQFESDQLKNSIDRLMTLQPRYFYLTHFGRVVADSMHASQLKKHIDAYVAIAMAHARAANPQPLIAADLIHYSLEQLAANGSRLTPAEQTTIINADMQINAQGLALWLQQTAA